MVSGVAEDQYFDFTVAVLLLHAPYLVLGGLLEVPHDPAQYFLHAQPHHGLPGERGSKLREVEFQYFVNDGDVLLLLVDVAGSVVADFAPGCGRQVGVLGVGLIAMFHLFGGVAVGD